MLIQFPNVSLIVALLASLAGYVVSGRAHSFINAVFYVALTIWAYAEITQGVNFVRKALGLVVLAYILFSLADALPH